MLRSVGDQRGGCERRGVLIAGGWGVTEGLEGWPGHFLKPSDGRKALSGGSRGLGSHPVGPFLLFSYP